MITILKIVSIALIGCSSLTAISAVRLGQLKSPAEKEYELIEQDKWLREYCEKKEKKARKKIAS